MAYDPRGFCPHCQNSDGVLDVGENHYGICRKHKTYWWIGINQNTGNPGEQHHIWEKNVALFWTWVRTDGHHTPELPP